MSELEKTIRQMIANELIDAAIKSVLPPRGISISYDEMVKRYRNLGFCEGLQKASEIVLKDVKD